MQTSVNDKNGFSLVELILYVGVTGGVLVVVSLLFAQLTQTRVKNQTITEVNRQGAHVLQTVERAVRSAESIDAPSAGSSGDTLSLQRSDASRDPTVFSVDDNQLTITQGSDSPQVLTNDRVVVSDISFSNRSRADTPEVVQMMFTLSHVNPNNRQPRSYKNDFQIGVSLR